MTSAQSPLDLLRGSTFPDVRWDASAKPILIADGRLHSIDDLDSAVDVSRAYIVGVNQSRLVSLCRYLRAATAHFYEMRVEDLAPLQQLGGIEHLAIRWNTKLKDLSPLARLSNLETLILEDVPKVEDLAPLAHLQKLLALDFSGGIWNKNRARSLLPFAGLPRLQELRLYNLRVDSDGLRPLAGCKTLQSLSVSNQFPTEDYAFRAAALPSTHCGMFAPFVHIATPIDGKDVMVVGKGKPFLNSTTDHVRLTEYVRQFEALREEARRSLAQSSLP